MKENLDAYKDIIDLPHHVSQNRTQMPLTERAAQFAPFAALTGFEDDVEETERITDARMEISEDEYVRLNERFNHFLTRIKEHPFVVLTIFVEDKKKSGGMVRQISGQINKYNENERVIYLSDYGKIKLDDILDIEEKIF